MSVTAITMITINVFKNYHHYSKLVILILTCVFFSFLIYINILVLIMIFALMCHNVPLFNIYKVHFSNNPNFFFCFLFFFCRNSLKNEDFNLKREVFG